MINEKLKILASHRGGDERSVGARRFWIAIASELGPKHPTFDCPAIASTSSLQ
jgi:hypothetical protein